MIDFKNQNALLFNQTVKISVWWWVMKSDRKKYVKDEHRKYGRPVKWMAFEIVILLKITMQG